MKVYSFPYLRTSISYAVVKEKITSLLVIHLSLISIKDDDYFQEYTNAALGYQYEHLPDFKLIFIIQIAAKNYLKRIEILSSIIVCYTLRNL